MWCNLSIRHRLALITLATTSAALLLASGALFTFELVNFRQTVAWDLTAAAEIVAANCSAPISFAQVDEAEEALVTLQAKPHILAAAIYLPNNTLFAGYSPPGAVPSFPPAPLSDGSSLRGGRLRLFHPVRHGPTRLGTIYLEYDYNAKLGELLKLYVGIGLMVVVTSLLLAVFLFTRLQQVISGPILALSSTLAGNLFIVGSIANIIVVNAARPLGVTIDFKTHARTGIRVTLATLAIAAAWLWVRAPA